MTIKPLVSIITPSFNQGSFIEETIRSVVNQTYCNIEYIIVDGGSTDRTLEIINRYKNYVNVVISEKDNGQAHAINKGFRIANGNLIGWINSDDYLATDCVERIVQTYLQNRKACLFYFTQINIVDQKGEFLRKGKSFIPNKNYLLNRNYNIIQPGSFYKSESVHLVGFINENKRFCMDLDLWLRLLSVGEISSIEGEPGANFRIWEKSKSVSEQKNFLKEIYSTIHENGGNLVSLNLFQLAKHYFQMHRERFKTKVIKSDPKINCF